jgi:hypothetical protein
VLLLEQANCLLQLKRPSLLSGYRLRVGAPLGRTHHPRHVLDQVARWDCGVGGFGDVFSVRCIATIGGIAFRDDALNPAALIVVIA